MGRFEGESNYRSDYVKYMEPPRSSCKPVEVSQVSNSALDDQTMYRKHYIPFDVAPREPKTKALWIPNKTPLDGMTTFRRDFTPKRIDITESCKPSQNAHVSDAAFVDETTMRNDFKKWQVERPNFHEYEMYIPPKGEMDMATTHNLNFTPKPIDKAVAKRPHSRQRVTAAFCDATNYKVDYRPWGINARTQVQLKDTYVPPKAAFQGTPTYRAHYVAHEPQPVGSFKPAIKSTDPGAFDDNTMYRVEYVPKRIDPCPASYIETNASYRFDCEDIHGHKWYTPGSTDTNVMAQKGSVSAC